MDVVMPEFEKHLDHPFVRYADNLQSQALVKPALTQLSQAHLLSQNVLIYMLWFSTSAYGRIRKSHLQTLLAELSPWHTRVVQALKLAIQTPQPFQADLQKEFLLALTVEQCLLADVTRGLTKHIRTEKQQLNDASFNLVAYYKHEKVHFTQSDYQANSVILETAFPTLSPQEIRETFLHAMSTAKLHKLSGEQLSFVI